MGAVFSLAINFVDLECGVAGCGIQFALTQGHYNKIKQTGGFFYCPNGHNIHFFDSENEKLKQELEIAKNDAAWVRKQRDKLERQKNAIKGVVTRIKNRVGNGVCPCCNRSFVNLQRHMHKEHPDFRKEESDGKV